MKKVIFIWIIALVVCTLLAFHFYFSPKTIAGEKATWAKQAFTELCQANIRLAKQVEELSEQVGDIYPFFAYDVPRTSFFVLIDDLAKRGENTRFEELAYELADDNRMLRMTIDQFSFTRDKK